MYFFSILTIKTSTKIAKKLVYLIHMDIDLKVTTNSQILSEILLKRLLKRHNSYVTMSSLKSKTILFVINYDIRGGDLTSGPPLCAPATKT